MLHIENHVPIKETFKYLSQFPCFSLVEKINPKFFSKPILGANALAHRIRDLIISKAKEGKMFILGLATGTSPLNTYRELVRLHVEEGLSFKNVITFQLDQYYPISKDDQLSYHYYLKTNLYDKIDLLPQNIHTLNGEISKSEVTKFCEQYEKSIVECGGVDLQILGIGRSGHIGYNQPPSPANSRTRIVYLNRITRKDASGVFRSIDKVPKCALTMGVSTIKRAKEIIIMAWSEDKAPIVKASIEGQKNSNNPVTFLHDHPNLTFYLDKDAGGNLSRFTVPWTIKGDDVDPQIPRTAYWIIKSVIWLSEKIQKPILRLTTEDYEDNGLTPLAIDVAGGNVEKINLFVYNNLREKITGWPLGDRPPTDQVVQTNRIQKKSFISEKILIFSPHPDDDVISMGGTAHRLTKQGHTVYVAYMVPGSNAVHDHDAKKYLFLVENFMKMKLASAKSQNEKKFYTNFYQSYARDGIKGLDDKKHSETRQDQETILKVKSLIRSSEAKIAIQTFGMKEKNTFCLNLPFYGSNKKKQPISEQDYKIVRNLLKMTEPSVIYAAGDLTDPHGTHRKCLEVILEVVDQQYEKKANDPNYKCLVPPPERIFFYRGAWEEWDLALAKYLVFMSPIEVEEKKEAILKHQSQKDTPMFPGDDIREFWVRVKERNRNTAVLLKKLGFPEYQAVECFVDLNDLRDGDSI